MQKGYKRTGKGIAVLHFFIGLIVLAIVVFAIYFFVNMMDYSDRLGPETSMRPYVEVTAAPETAEPVVTEVPSTEAPEVVDISGVTAVEATPEPTVRPTPVPTPIMTPVPTPIATPTPVPTAIPASALSQAATSGFQVPTPSTNATIGLSKIYASVADGNKILQLSGYGYIDDAAFDGAGTQTFVIITQKASGRQVAYRASMIAGVSDVDHSAAQCANAASTDFEAFLNLAPYQDGEYGIGIVMNYSYNGSKIYSYHVFDETFTVSGGAMVDTSVAAGSFG